ncbi:MAG: VCBS repeat-containing protein [candidate division Zixibacteria bacterium]|nr:VCBS repeat-containing protein [candidate division Zixibacteria bacterium]
MKNIIVRSIPMTVALLVILAALWIALGGCGSKERNNPLDPDNPDVSADLFGVTLTMRTAAVHLDWTAVDHEAIEGYRVYRREGDQNTNLIATLELDHLSFYDSPVEIDVDYYYSLAAYDSEGQVSMRSPAKHILTSDVNLYDQPNHYGIGEGPRSLATSDFNNDGYIDIAVALHQDDQVGILFNDGTGGFTSTAIRDVTAGPYTVSVGDFDDDEDDDIVVACSESDSVTFLWNNGGNFDNISYFDFMPTSSVHAGYIDEDSRCDVLMVTTEGHGYFVTSLLNGFSANMVTNELGPWAKAVLVDFREIGYQDMISVSQTEWQGDNTRVFHGGLYGPEVNQEWLMMWAPASLVAADFDGNEQTDFAVVTYGYPDYPLYAHGVHVFINIGNGIFNEPVRYADDTWTGGQLGRPFLYGICALDTDNDGNMDLATTSVLFSTVAVWRGRGDGTFDQPTSWITDSIPYDVTAADFDNDGDFDLAVANYGSGTVSIFINNTR